MQLMQEFPNKVKEKPVLKGINEKKPPVISDDSNIWISRASPSYSASLICW